LGTIDVVSGFSGALATNLALFKRLRTGQSDLARTSLAANAQLIQTPFMIEVAPQTSSLQAPYREDRSQPAEARGPAVMGDNALYMFYETNDGHIFLAAPFVEPKRHAAASNLAEALRLDVDVLGPPPRPRWCGACGNNERWVSAVASAFKRLDTMTAISVGRDAGLAVSRLTSMKEIRNTNLSDTQSFHLGQGASDFTWHFYRQHDHPIGGPVTMFAPCSVLAGECLCV
jgi:crotonobetainyl-CoA:carnitine CoA-transferase CaiB-like acyl-CoA transferase